MQAYLIGEQDTKSFKKIAQILTESDLSVIVHPDKNTNFWTQFKDAQNTVNAVDVVIADGDSISQDFKTDIAMAIEQKKPTLILMERGSEFVDEVLDIRQRHVRVQTYKNEQELEVDINRFIDEMKDKLIAKMFMNIPPEMNKYLDWVVANTEKTKSDVVRAAVNTVADRDQDYQEFLKTLKKK